MKPGILAIVGPTASGKKMLAMKAAEQFGGEIVSADSRKVYRFLDIGTAKPSREDRARIPHHLIDIVDPDELFSAGEWVRLASAAIKDILARGVLPIISCGTGFYLEAFQNGLTESIDADQGVRNKLENELEEKGLNSLYDTLKNVDPARASELHENDAFRIMRALEVYYTTGKPFSALRNEPRVSGGDYDYYIIGLRMEREELYKRIGLRVDNMVSNGLLQEVESILNRGYSRNLTALDTVGYKEWFQYIDGKESFEHCMELIKRNTRRYSKRQMTWFRMRQGIRWLDDADRTDFLPELIKIDSWLNDRSR